MKAKTIAILMVLFSTILTSLGQLFYKLGANKLPNIFNNYFLMIGLIIYFTALIIFIYALKNGELSILYPIYATSYILVAILSFFILKENINLLEWIGIGFIISGVIVVSKS